MVPLVIRAANLLSVDELEVFKLAHKFWHNRSAENHVIKQLFNKYLEKKVVPPWVMHFARTVVQAYERGNFEPVIFGISPTFEAIPFSWSIAFNTPRSFRLNDANDLLVA